MRVVLGGLQSLHIPNFLVGDACDPAGAVFSRVQHPELNRVHGKFGRQFIDQCLTGKPGRWAQRGAVGGDFRFIDHYVIPFCPGIWYVIRGKDSHRCQVDQGTWEGAGLVD